MDSLQGLGLISVPLMTAVLFAREVAGPPMLAGLEPRLGAGLGVGAADGLRADEKAAWRRGGSILLGAIPSFKAGAPISSQPADDSWSARAPLLARRQSPTRASMR